MNIIAEEYQKRLLEQLSLDLNCSPGDLTGWDNVVTASALRPGRRSYSPGPPFLEMATLGRGTVMMADPRLHGFLRELIGAPLRNVMNLFPMGWGAVGTVAGIVLAIAAVYAGYVYRKPGFSPGMIARLAAVGAVPYARYLVLANHSYLHVFFTFRAQLAALLAIALILCELTGWGKRQYVR